MSNETHDPDTGEIYPSKSISDEHIEADRGVPEVAKLGAGRTIGMAVFLIICTLILGAVIYDGMSKNTNKPITKSEEMVFKAPNARGEPYIVEEPIAPPKEPLQSAAAAPSDPLLLQREIAMQEEAMRLARARREEMEQRLKSPQLVYDKSREQAAPSSTPYSQTHSGGATLLSGGSNETDPNLAFAKSQSNIGVKTAQATQLRNLPTLIAQGELIGGILETAIQSDLPGMVRAITSENVYSFDGSNLLIPKGTRLVGQYRSGTKQGQSRVFVIWNRLIRPDGASINLGSIGTDSLGRSGLSGDVDTHFMQRFGSSILLSMIDGALSAAVESVSDSNSSDVSLNGSNDFSRSAEIALEDSIGIKPTIHIDQGTRIKIFVGQDLDFSQVGAFSAL
ncbi:MAG: conjugal transfer protein [Alphaproteobacteria bacterium]|nr:MAG: conjugal transfer protein [Alphaproteobacteria bacterium]